jgi:hypothetical protein
MRWPGKTLASTTRGKPSHLLILAAQLLGFIGISLDIEKAGTPQDPTPACYGLLSVEEAEASAHPKMIYLWCCLGVAARRREG